MGSIEQGLLRKLLANHTVEEVVKDTTPREIVKAYVGETVDVVTKRMMKERLSSLPVFDSPPHLSDSEKSAGRSKCIGIVDYGDFVGHLLASNGAEIAHGSKLPQEESKDNSKQSSAETNAGTSADERVKSLTDKANQNHFWDSILNVPVEEAIGKSKSHRGSGSTVFKLSKRTALGEATKLIYENRLKRIIVSEDEGDDVYTIDAIVTPPSLVSWILAKLKGKLDPALAQSVQGSEIGSKPVIYVKKSQGVLEAFHTMMIKGHTITAVIDDETGVLAGSISMSDISLLFKTRQILLLVATSWQYIVQNRNLSDQEYFPFFGVSETTKVQTVLSKMLATDVHHLYVVDDDQKPCAVISYTDICRLLTSA